MKDLDRTKANHKQQAVVIADLRQEKTNLQNRIAAQDSEISELNSRNVRGATMMRHTGEESFLFSNDRSVASRNCLVSSREIVSFRPANCNIVMLLRRHRTN